MSSGNLHILVLGAAAGGGLPQWNCNCPVCRAAWEKDASVRHRTQSSIAVSADGANWCVINCSPDIRQQIISNSQLHPRDPAKYGRRDTPIGAVVLTNADVDHIAGLLVLREKQALKLFATGRVLDVLNTNKIFSVLDPEFVSRSELTMGADTEIGAGVWIEPFVVPGKVALYLEEGADLEGRGLEIGGETEDTIGLRLSTDGGGKTAYYIPGCAAMPDALAERLRDADLVLFDGTVWHNDEMIAKGVGQKTGHRMGHMSMDGPGGSIAALADLGIRRKVFIHINNTNPVLVDGSAEQGALEAAGWELAYDGMELKL